MFFDILIIIVISKIVIYESYAYSSQSNYSYLWDRYECSSSFYNLVGQKPYGILTSLLISKISNHKGPICGFIPKTLNSGDKPVTLW